jgi:hypothetical protein
MSDKVEKKDPNPIIVAMICVCVTALFVFVVTNIDEWAKPKTNPMDAFTVSRTCTWLTQGDTRVFCPDGTVWLAIQVDTNVPFVVQP